MGNDDAVSSLHKDHYENMYIVITGEKHFTLLPQTDLFYLYEGKYTEARYRETENGFVIEEEVPKSEVPWIPVDPDKPNLTKFPLFKHSKPIRCTVKAGEMLYLPSLYYHRVSQSADKEGRTIAINFWYDMNFSLNWCYFKFMEKVGNEKRKEIEKITIK